MIRFLKEIYLTGFTILFKLSRAKKITYRAGGAMTIITLIESFNLTNISSWIDIFAGKQIAPRLSEPEYILVFLVLAYLNLYVLIVCGFTFSHGLPFEHEFNNLKKSRKIALVTSCVVLLLDTIVFSIYSISAHRHFIQEMTATL
jgi:hypothetical protein